MKFIRQMVSVNYNIFEIQVNQILNYIENYWFPFTFNKGFGTSLVSGYILLPNPAPKIIASLMSDITQQG